MAAAARAKGYAYLAIADHSQARHRRPRARRRSAWRGTRGDRPLDGRLGSFRLLKAIEVDILDDGTARLSRRDAPAPRSRRRVGPLQRIPAAEAMTERIIRAMDNPLFSILAHPTGRLLNERHPYEVDIERVLRPPRSAAASSSSTRIRAASISTTSTAAWRRRWRQDRDLDRRPPHGRPRRDALRRRPGAPRLAGGRGRSQRAALA